mgnify:CR=1 FL=1
MFELPLLSIGLAMDAFAVALVRGSTGEKRLSRAFGIGFAFGIAQGLMPLLGWVLGKALGASFQAYDHWIAFVLLLVLGVRMIKEAFGEPEIAPDDVSRVRLLSLLTAAFATSIDAAAAGLTLPLLGISVPLACLAIGATTALLCTAGYWIGARVSGIAGKRAELLGGILLIAVGSKILVEHLTA